MNKVIISLHRVKLLYNGFRYMGTAKPYKRKTKSEKQLARAFVDYKKLTVCGGNGGDGMMAFTSLPYKEFAGPDGGDGGNGGHVIFQAVEGMKSLDQLKSIYRAVAGKKGRSRHMHGSNAEHTIIEVPLGTVFKDEAGVELASLEKPGEAYLAARGGMGGKGNHFFLSNENRAPTIYEQGGTGEERVISAELRIMAHSGLVGFPNAGKSTLLRAISRATPKVAAYPFTTLKPHIGMVEYPDLEQVAVADIPGLISGAHLNYGLGISFLRHIERCVCLLYVLDLSHDEPWTQLEQLKYELEQYQEGLSERPHAVVANKIDTPGAEDKLNLLRQEISLDIFPVSAKHKINIKPLLLHLRELYDKYHQKTEDS